MHVSSRDRAVRLRRRRSRLRFPRIAEIGEQTTTLALEDAWARPEDSETARWQCWVLRLQSHDSTNRALPSVLSTRQCRVGALRSVVSLDAHLSGLFSKHR
jgi:hypothetical protein